MEEVKLLKKEVAFMKQVTFMKHLLHKCNTEIDRNTKNKYIISNLYNQQ
jgi:hypothetical protein